MTVGEVVGKLKLDKKQWNASIQKSQGDLKRFEKKQGAFAKAFKMSWLKVVGSIAAVGLALRKIMGTFGDFEQRMSDVSTLLNDEAMPALEGMRQGILDMVKELPKSADELGAGLYQTLSAGIREGADALNVLRESTKLAVVGLSTTKESVNLMTSAINAYELSAQDANKVGNIFFKAVKFGKTTVAELSQAFGTVAPLAAEMGVELDDLNAATAALTTGGIKTAEAQTYLRQSIAALLKPTADMQKLFNLIGVKDGKELIKTSGGLVDSFIKLKDVAEKNNIGLAEAYGRIQGLVAAMSLSDATNEKYNETLASMRDGLDIVNKGVDKQKETFKSAMQIMKSNITIFAVSIGAKLSPAIIEIIELVPKIPEIFKKSLEIAGLIIREFLTDPKPFIAFSNMVVNILGGVILAIPKLIATALTPLISFFDFIGDKIGTGFFNILQDIKGKINVWIEAINKMLPERFQLGKLQQLPKQVAATAKEAFDEMTATTKVAFDETKKAISDTFLVAGAGAKELFGVLKENEEIKQGFIDLNNIIADTGIKAKESQEIIRAEQKITVDIQKETIENQITMFDSFKLGIMESVNKWKSGNAAMQEAGRNFIRDFQSSFTSNVVNAIINGGNVMKSVFKSVTSSMLRMFIDMISKMMIKKALLALIPGKGLLGFLHEGGAVKKHTGGQIKKAHQGMLAQDEVPTILQTGESVLNRRATRNIGEANVNALNAGLQPQLAGAGVTNVPVNINIGGNKIAEVLLKITRQGVKVVEKRGVL